MVISVTQSCNLVIFGAKGDLVRRKLLPSLYQLEKMNAIHPNTCIIGVGRAMWDSLFYRNRVIRVALEEFMLEPINESVWKIFSARFQFCNLDVKNISAFDSLLRNIHCVETCVIIYYFAVPPDLFGAICQGLGMFGLNKKSSRIVMEKPLGTGLNSARLINSQVAKYFDEDQIYRIDHYLGKETVLNLLALRFANSLFAYNWDHRIIDHVQITVAEEVGIEGRWGYFDSIGQMRDMVQSHLLQILTIIAMSPPSNLTADCIRDEKVKVLRDLRVINDTNICNIVRGQYVSGYMSNNRKVPGYLEESGANKHSITETFVAIRVDIDNWRWAGVPFYLRTGKRLPTKSSEVVVVFKRPIHNLFCDSYHTLPNNRLIIRLQPNEGIDMKILSRMPGLGHKHQLQIAALDLKFIEMFNQEYLFDAYERLLLEAMNGIQTLFVRRDEVECAWKWVDSIIQSWCIVNNHYTQLKFYSAGTWGPEASSAMIARDGRCWNENSR
ncbi:Glucose-6-phosphate 1-dehydrogenase [Blochmannia endosymbiont of Polyrhachis (Hedomyrma) turneri]|nr:Glucose-6-phosphate 1-dehydrogenase [Blochmannia endosymbiont of Polyrhachis (Hedomyrma) turneri]